MTAIADTTVRVAPASALANIAMIAGRNLLAWVGGLLFVTVPAAIVCYRRVTAA